MLDGKNIQELVEGIDTASIRVYAPTSLIFLCGGKADPASTTLLSLRGAFLRFAYEEPYQNHQIVLAEELNFAFPNEYYDNILTLEADMAQISDLIVLFSESFGSAAELGAFAMIAHIASNLLVIVDDFHYSEHSFIKLGPLLALEKTYGEGSVCVVNRSDININSIKDVSSLDIQTFKQRVNSAVKIRLEQTKAHTSFDKSNDGHLIKLIVGLIQHYGSLIVSEIKFHLECIGIDVTDKRLNQFLQCAEFAEWIVKDKRGIRTYYTARTSNSAIKYNLSSNAKTRNRDRWRLDVREYYQKNDPDRFSSIAAALRGSTNG